MDLISFSKKNKKKEISRTIIDNEEITLFENNEDTTIILKSKDALKKYETQLFMAPTTAIITKSEKDAEQFFRKALKDGTEGLMFKSLSSQYKAGVRTGSITKLKETKEDLDVVIVGAEHGKGKRAGFYSSFYIGVRDSFQENESYLTIGKVSSGIKELESDEGVTLNKLTQLLKPLKLSEKKGFVQFEPKIIIQIRYQEIQKSTTYNSGFALRFPRIIMLREDKALDEIATLEDIKKSL